MKIKVKTAPLEWDDLVLQEQLKSLMYVDHSIRGDQMKDKLIDELNFKSCMSLRENKRSKLFIGITSKKEFYYSSRFFYTNNIISETFIQNLKRKPNMFHDLSRKISKSL